MNRLPLVLALTAAVVVGCGTPNAPAAAPARERMGAPVILAARDLRSRASEPCATLLTPPQLKELGFPQPGVFSVNDLGPTCDWNADGPGTRSTSASVVVTRDLFLDTYAARPLAIFRPTEIRGLPAVDLQSFEGAPTCTTTVGVADGQTLDITSARGTEDESGVDPCGIGRRVAEEIVSTLPPL